MDGTQLLVAFGIISRNVMGYGNTYRAGRYLENVTPESCLEDLSKALSVKSDEFEHLEDIFNMFSATDLTGSRYWDQTSFTKYLKAKHPDNLALESCAPLLWRCFLYHAYIPFSQQRSSTNAASESERSSINLKAFQRATTLLVLKGVDLLGSSKHGDRILPYPQYSRYPDERPRLAKLMFNGLSVPMDNVQLKEEKEETSPDTSPDLYARPEQEIFDTLISIQPCGVMHSPLETQTRIHAKRLLGLVAMSEPCRILQRNDLEAVVQLLLLVRVTKQPWVHTYPPCEAVYYAHLVSDSAEVARTANLASVLIMNLPGAEDSGVDWPSFCDICISSFPFLVFSFSQLWTSIFAPHNSSNTHEQLKANSPNSIVRFLSLIKLAEFKYDDGSGPRYNELELQLDLQAASLVVDLNAEAVFNGQILLEEVNKKDGFHFLLLSGQKEACKDDDDSRNVLVVVFLSPPGKKIWHLSIRGGSIEYTWRVSILQLEPEVKMSYARGMVFGLSDEGMTFLASDDKNNDAAGLRLDLENKSAVMVGTVEKDASVAPDKITEAATRLLADTKAAKERKGGDVKDDGQIWSLQMKIQSLQCYRMPGRIMSI